MKFKYDYKDGYVLTTIGIEPASSDIDLSSLDLANNPIKIVLNSKDGETIQFVFDDNSKIGSQSQLLKVGKYTLTILSEKTVKRTSPAARGMPSFQTFGPGHFYLMISDSVTRS